MSKRYEPPAYTEEQLREQREGLREIAELQAEIRRRKEKPETSLDIVDYGDECTMCGKPMPYRYSRMCTTCEMVYNS